MKKCILCLLFGICLISATTTVYAQDQIDMSTLTCKDLLEIENEDDAAAVMIWLDGYLSGITGDQVIDFKGMEQFMTNLINFAQRNPNVSLIKASELVGTE